MKGNATIPLAQETMKHNLQLKTKLKTNNRLFASQQKPTAPYINIFIQVYLCTKHKRSQAYVI